jgi:hypothetical protein
MPTSSQTTDVRFASLVKTLGRTTGVTGPSKAGDSKKKFGSDALKIGGKIFAMLSHDRLVVKLPRARVDELVAAGDGERFDPGHGRVMKEWLSLDPSSELEWLPLAKEAMKFVRSKS